MSAGEVIGRIVAKLDAAGIPHMVAGSFASTYHGVPRSTQDIDIVIDPAPATLDALLASLPDGDYYVDGDTARDALRRRSQFNLIDMATGWKPHPRARIDREERHRFLPAWTVRWVYRMLIRPFIWLGRRGGASALVLLAVLGACGGDPSSTASIGGGTGGDEASRDCDGTGPAVPAGYPPLGAACATHARYDWSWELVGSSGSLDVAATRGVRRLEDGGTYDLGAGIVSPGGNHDFAMYLPSLAPGLYRGGDGAAIERDFLGLYSTSTRDRETGVLVEIVGRSERAIWGRFVARLCAEDASKADCFRYAHGRFAAAIETVPSSLELGYPPSVERGMDLCETPADCPVVDSITPLCVASICTGGGAGG